MGVLVPNIGPNLLCQEEGRGISTKKHNSAHIGPGSEGRRIGGQRGDDVAFLPAYQSETYNSGLIWYVDQLGVKHVCHFNILIFQYFNISLYISYLIIQFSMCNFPISLLNLIFISKGVWRTTAMPSTCPTKKVATQTLAFIPQ